MLNVRRSIPGRAMISDEPISPTTTASKEEVARLTREVEVIGSVICFWCGFKAAAGFALIFWASDRDLAAHRLVAGLWALIWAGASVLGWLVKTQANRTAARLLLLLPVALAIFIMPGTNAPSQPAMFWRVMFILVYAAGAIEAIRVTNRIYRLPGVNIVL